ncbi:hypothetical protein [Aeromicrobium alkaliterrae]
MSDATEDPGGDVGNKAIRVTMVAASMAASRLARELAERQQRRREEAELERAQSDARWQAERATAQSQVRAADAAWLQAASAEEAARTWSTAHAWAEVDPAFRGDADRIRAGIEQRWGVSVSASDTEASLREAADRQRFDARAEDGARVVDEVAAGSILADTPAELAALEDADRHASNAGDHEAAAASLDASADAAAYDSQARRDQLVDRATTAGVDPVTARGRGRAANANAEPVKNATQSSKTPKKAGRRGRANGRERSDQLTR